MTTTKFHFANKMETLQAIEDLNKNGFSILPNLFTHEEVDRISHLIDSKTVNNKQNSHSGVFAIRELLIKIPELLDLLLNDRLKALITSLRVDNPFFITKAIYFDKPKDSNWSVAFHQDLSINVEKKIESNGFVNWTKKQNQIDVQAPLKILENVVTLRIHLDDTDESNGALYVLPNSHRNGVIRTNFYDLEKDQIACKVKHGGVMLMKPLTLHSSKKSRGENNRRVIHLELGSMELPDGLEWKERIDLDLV